MDIQRALDILGIKQGSTEVEVKKAYRVKVKQYHPDTMQSETGREVFHSVCEAYTILMEKGTISSGRLTHASIFDIIEKK